MKRLILLGITAALVLAGCNGCKPTAERRAQWMVKHLSSKLDLDKAQKAKLDGIKAELIARRAAAAKEHQDLRAALATSLKGEQPLDQVKWNEWLGERPARAEARRFYIAKIAEFHAVLRPEQREKLVKLMEKWPMGGFGD